MSLASPSKIQKTREGWQAIEKVVDYTHAVGRIGDRGSCILISLPVPANSVQNGNTDLNGILLTTSFVVHCREEAKLANTVTFLEQPVTGTGAKWDAQPIAVQLRADKVFFCSAKEPPKRPTDFYCDEDGDSEDQSPKQQVEELGYSIMSCNIQSIDSPKNDIRRIVPIPLPLIVSRIPSIAVGDVHLLVTHENSKTRKYVVVTVSEVHEHHCTYAYVDPTSMFASGGAVFTSNGEFIGIQHQCGDSSYCIFVRDIVSHLFDVGMLGVCKIPVLSADTEDARDEEGELNANAAINDTEFNQAFQVTSRSRLYDVGAGDQIVSFSELEIVRKRKENGTSKAQTVTIRRHTEVWDEWTSFAAVGSAEYYRTLILMLRAFPYQSKLCVRALTELTSHANRSRISSVSQLGGVGIILEVLDSHPHDPLLVQTAVTSLARVSLYDANKESIARSDGVPVILAVMREFMGVYEVQQWAFYLLLNLLQDGTRADECAEAIMKYAGLEVMLQSISRHVAGKHLQRWGWQSVGYTVRRSAHNSASVIARGLNGLHVLLTQMEAHWRDSFALYGMVFALHCFLRELTVPPLVGVSTIQWARETFDIIAALSFPVHVHAVARPEDAYDIPTAEEIAQRHADSHAANGCLTTATFLEFLEALINHHGSSQGGDAALTEYLMLTLLDSLEIRNDFVDVSSRSRIEGMVARCTEVFMTEVRMHSIAEKIMRHVAVADPFGKYSHLQREKNPTAYKDL